MEPPVDSSGLPRLEPGTTIALRGLVRASELNGAVGKVVSYDRYDERYLVALQSSSAGSSSLQVKVKRDNVQVQGPGAHYKPTPAGSAGQPTVECSVCMTNVKDTVLVDCGHVFCGACVESLLAQPQRSCLCPNCRTPIRSPPKRVFL